MGCQDEVDDAAGCACTRLSNSERAAYPQWVRRPFALSGTEGGSHDEAACRSEKAVVGVDRYCENGKADGEDDE